MAESGTLQHKEGTFIVLVPQPIRNDPNDPLVGHPKFLFSIAY
jgi:hypothetical protein